MLNDKEENNAITIKMLVDGEITRKEASLKLGKSLRQVDRMKKIYLEKGENGLIHKNRGKKNLNKISDTIISEIETLYLDEYYDYNLEQFYEEISSNYNLKYDTMLKRFKADDIISPLAHKKTVKQYTEKMKCIEEKAPDDKKVDVYKSRIIEVEKAHTRRPSNLFVFGQEIQMDACEKIWFGGMVSYLHLAVDKATKKVLFGWFEYEEITRGYYVLLFHIILNYGIPAKIKADNRSSFTVNKTGNQKNKQFFTQFGKVCEELNIVLETTSVSTAKANVERENKTFKDRLIAEFRHKKINNIDDANEYLNNIFIPKMNEKFSYVINEKTSVMRKNNYSEEELKLIISEKYTRIIDNASSISYGGKYYIPINVNTGEVTCFMRGVECQFIINYDGEYFGKIEEVYYKMTELENRDSMMKKELQTNTIKKEHHKYIPPKNHPWRKSVIFKY